MMRSPSFFMSSPDIRKPRNAARKTQGVADFLRAHDRMALLLPAVSRMAALQKDCTAILPSLFETCTVMRFDAGQLVLATPNAAMAAKLKQQLPRLQDGLVKRAWQVSAIRIKVQVSNISEKTTPTKQLRLPSSALSALATLEGTLENSPGNAALKAAIGAMLKRHQAGR